MTGTAELLDNQVTDSLTLLETLLKGEQGDFIGTGIPALDKVVPVGTTDLVIVAARPGVGKTTMGLNVAHHLVREGKPVVFVSTEMPAARLLHRLAGLDAGVSPFELFGHPDHPALPDFLRALDALRQAPLVIVDQAGILSDDPKAPGAWTSVSGIVDSLVAQGAAPAAVIVDYLGRLGDCDQGQNRTQAVGRAARNLKNLALRAQVPVFLLSQLNRECEKREDRRPILADLRESGDVEQEADSVLLLFRHDYYFRPGQAGYNPELAGKMEVHVAKNRFGPGGVLVESVFDAKTGRIGRWKADR